MISPIEVHSYRSQASDLTLEGQALATEKILTPHFLPRGVTPRDASTIKCVKIYYVEQVIVYIVQRNSLLS